MYRFNTIAFLLGCGLLLLRTAADELESQSPVHMTNLSSNMSASYNVVTVKTYNGRILILVQLSDGSVVHCVHLKYLSNSSSAMKHHDSFPRAGSGWRNVSRPVKSLFTAEVPQGCPTDTITVQRGDIFDDISPRFKSTRARKSTRKGRRKTPSDLNAAYAIYFDNQANYYSGVGATLSIQAPFTNDDEFSISQIWVVVDQNTPYSTLEAGWIASRSTFEDSEPRLFVYWTNDDYEQTGCFNLLCPGFVQADDQWTLGEPFPDGSSTPGDANNQQSVSFSIFMDATTQTWYLEVGGTTIGYWDNTIVTNFANRLADEIQMGGEVQIQGVGTTTAMGSSYFPQFGFPWAADFTSLWYSDNQFHGYLFAVNQLSSFASYPHFYGIGDLKQDDNGNVDHFFFGGPGSAT